MTIEPEETDIVGQWVVQDGRVIADEATRRIELLIKEHLEIVAACGWEQLFLDPTDGVFGNAHSRKVKCMEGVRQG